MSAVIMHPAPKEAKCCCYDEQRPLGGDRQKTYAINRIPPYRADESMDR